MNETAERFYAHGMWISADALKVTEYPSGDIVIASADAPDQKRLDDGTFEVVGAERPASLPGVTRGAVYSIGPWSAINSMAPGYNCFTRFNGSMHLSWIDACYMTLRLSNDGNSTYDFFISTMFATFGGYAEQYGSYATWGMIQTRTTATAGGWQDWEPQGSWTTNCQSGYYEISVPYYGGLAYGEPWQRCDEMIMSKSANGTLPRLREEYFGGVNTQGINIMMGYHALQGSSSSLIFNYGVRGCVVFGPCE